MKASSIQVGATYKGHSPGKVKCWSVRRVTAIEAGEVSWKKAAPGPGNKSGRAYLESFAEWAREPV